MKSSQLRTKLELVLECLVFFLFKIYFSYCKNLKGIYSDF